MSRNEDFVARSAAQKTLSVGQMSRLERRVDNDLIVALFEREHLVMRKEKAPVLLVIRGSIGYPIGIIGQSEQMRFQHRQRHGYTHGHAVIQHVQAGAS